MLFQELNRDALIAIEMLQQYMIKYGSRPSLESIVKQMDLIADQASKSANPYDSVDDSKPFTFGIISSREFASPEEMKIKDQLDKVSDLLGG